MSSHSDVAEAFKDWKKESQQKRMENNKNSTRILESLKIEFVRHSLDHLHVAQFDFWPTTGLFIHRQTKERGRGVFNLIKALTQPQESK